MSISMNPRKKKAKSLDNIQAMRIRIASPEKILSWSHGEVKKPETINYRTFKPEPDGLFCEKIFGPNKDYECACGRYKRMKNEGVVCEKCGVEITRSSVRRERLGHIKLASPVSHIWFFKGMPSIISLMLNTSIRDLEAVLYFEKYIVVDPGDVSLSKLNRCQLMTEAEVREKKLTVGSIFRAEMGAGAIKDILKGLDLEEMKKELREEMLNPKASDQRKRKATKRLKIIEGFLSSGNRPEWMILDYIPVIPSELRPLVALDGGRFATSDLNDLYRRVINRNNRLKRLIELKAPDIILRNEKRMLQEAVDALFDNGRRGKVLKGANKRPLKSLSDTLKGKQGRFRQNLLGKRVDYSGRSVIVVGPRLSLYECGLPKKMALELFKPFVLEKLRKSEKISTPNIRSALAEIDKASDIVWDILDEVIKEHPVLLNRAPTLHRLGIQAFQPRLVEGKAIRLHPLVCFAFNADFDGDQMAVHLPLSIEAVAEARVLMLSSQNLLSPANGNPITFPSQDMILGLYYLTKGMYGQTGEGMLFSDYDEVKYALDNNKVTVLTRIKFRYTGRYMETRMLAENQELSDGIEKELKNQIFETTVGRVLLNESLPDTIPYINTVLKKKRLSALVGMIVKRCSHNDVIKSLDIIKELGFHYSTVAGISISIKDVVIPENKHDLIRDAEKKVARIEKERAKGLLTESERSNNIIDIWTEVKEKVSRELMDSLKESETRLKKFNPLFIMLDSGSRGSQLQISQLAGMRGLMAKPSGEIIETPITANFREGLNVIQYFISTHGARKGLADTAIKTADSGYLTRKLVDVSQDVVISEHDCGTIEGIKVSSIVESGTIIEQLSDRIFGRVALEDIKNPYTGEIIVQANEIIDAEAVKKISETNIDRIKIRSVLTCLAEKGVCSKCYGMDLSTGKLVEEGEAVGIIAAQSIGEPGTQLTMRTFHIGGIASKDVIRTHHVASADGKIIFDNLRYVEKKTAEGIELVALSRKGVVLIENEFGKIVDKKPIAYGTKVYVREGDMVEKGARLAEFDIHSTPIIAESSGIIRYHDIIDGQTLREEWDDVSNRKTKVIVESKSEDMQPYILIRKDTDKSYIKAKAEGIIRLKQKVKAKNLQAVPFIVIEDAVKKSEISETEIHFNYEPVVKDGDFVKVGDNLAEELFSIFIPLHAHLALNDGDRVEPGDIIAKIPREMTKTKDITGGLPRIVELFEARKPKECAVLSEIEGTVRIAEGMVKGNRIVKVESDDKKDVKKYEIPKTANLQVRDGEHVFAGEELTDYPANPHDILSILGEKELAKFLVKEIQKVYKLQNVDINDKHIEIIVRQMIKKVEIEEIGGSEFLYGERVNKQVYRKVNEQLMKEGKNLASGKPVLMGVTKASLASDSFIASASFQDTTRVLTQASIMGETDHLNGLKENIVIGKLIPAGTGFKRYRNLDISVPHIADELFRKTEEEEEEEEEEDLL